MDRHKASSRILLVLFALALASSAAAAGPTVERRTFWSALFDKPVEVVILLPESYSAAGPAHPALFILHGGFTNETYNNFDVNTPDWYGAELSAAGIVGIVPHIGAPWADGKTEPSREVRWEAGEGTVPGTVDFLTHGEVSAGGNNYELARKYGTHFTTELMPFVEAEYNVARDRSHRAIVGHSGGGYGTYAMGLRYPHLFSFLGATSGPLSIRHPICVASACGLAITVQGGRDPVTDEIYWRSRDPKDLADLFLEWPFTLFHSVGDQDIDAAINPINHDFHEHLEELGVAHTFIEVPGVGHAPGDSHGPVVRDDYIPAMVAHFANPPADPARWTFRTTERELSMLGWEFGVERFNTEFLTLIDVGKEGLVARGTGELSVRTPPLYAPGARHAVTRTAPGGATYTEAVLADGEGRLRFTVDLAPTRILDQHSLLEVSGVFPFEDFTISIVENQEAETDPLGECGPVRVYPLVGCSRGG